MSKEEEKQEIPSKIVDVNTKTTYYKGRFFGKGGFAKCYEIIDSVTRKTYAGKIVAKTLMVKQSQRDKITQEISIHRSLRHKNVVGFHSFFEDVHNVYIVLELCKSRSMMELHKRRKILTEPETRYYLKQILSGVLYLHESKIIHRDLKLGNLFLNDELHVKIGDFGLATKIEFDGDRKKTLCGTPNYIAPEILTKKGHSFEVDVWSIGCIMYTLLIGKPPFETPSLRETYSRIKKCDYKIASNVSQAAKTMIVLMLQGEPKLRPTVADLLKQEFLLKGFVPTTLPLSSLTMAPRFDKFEKNNRKPLSALDDDNKMDVDIIAPKNHQIISSNQLMPAAVASAFNPKENFKALRQMILQALKNKPDTDVKFADEMSDPASQPLVWISKWVDYSDKYGFGYQLCDETVGVMFNDTTKLIMLSNGLDVHYIDKFGKESYMGIDDYPKQMEKKMKLLSYFNRYMREHLIKAGASVAREADPLSRVPHLHQWVRSASSVLLQLNNGTVQINFTDHTKIMLCPLMCAVTFIDSNKSIRTFRFSSIEQHGCPGALYERMRYAYEKISVLEQQKSSET